ncbi:MAG: hypothetical protein GEV28_37355 [Actinophytocola sp.]|uniref:hypothetical protein n=1 Tax=Actinophytocola sp. TaxID=1872138 RepID=UPI0013214582|nr:hypothetical protein [Actinophytocola sp.]MPZ85744.1 hypothetical protein [Actinophytocola sp.]
MSERVLERIPVARRTRLCRSATIDLDATDVEVYGRKKRGVDYNAHPPRRHGDEAGCGQDRQRRQLTAASTNR